MAPGTTYFIFALICRPLFTCFCLFICLFCFSFTLFYFLSSALKIKMVWFVVLRRFSIFRCDYINSQPRGGIRTGTGPRYMSCHSTLQSKKSENRKFPQQAGTVGRMRRMLETIDRRADRNVQESSNSIYFLPFSSLDKFKRQTLPSAVNAKL